MQRKNFLQLLAAIALGVTALAAGAQQDFPNRPVRLITPFPPGGVADALARGIGAKLAERWKQPVVVDNRPGANTVIAAQELIKQSPDGHALMLALDMTLVMNQYLYRTPKYDPVKDFTPISRVAEFPFFLITRTDTGVKTVQEYVDRAKRDKGELKVGSAAIVTTIAAEILNRAAGVKTVPIQYKGTGDNTLALLRGDIDFIFDTDVTAAQHVRSGRLRILANSGARRVPNYPDVPTYKEVVPNNPEMTVWYGIVGPAGMSPALVAKMSTDIASAMQQPEVRAMLQEKSLDAASAGPEEFKQRVNTDSRKYGELIRQMNLYVD